MNTVINFVLSPFIVEHLGVEANGYISLANNMVSYLALIATALDSMAGRFILIDLRQNNTESANEYYSSVLFGDWFLMGIMLLPGAVMVAKLEWFFQVDPALLADVKLLFGITFFNFFLSLSVPKWALASYVTNKLYLRSCKTVISSVVRAAVIFILFYFCKPVAYFVAIAGTLMTITNIAIEFYYKKNLIPQLHIHWSNFRLQKIKTLLSSGIWNSVSKCGNLLLEGLDLLIANIFIDPVAMGVLSLSKIIPHMLNQIVGNIATTFGPRLTFFFADGMVGKIKKEVKKNIRIISIFTTIPIGITIALGKSFFSLWVPSQNATVLTVLSSLTLGGIVITGAAQCITNIFGVVNKLRLNSLVLIFSGLVNVAVVYVLLMTTDLGIYAIAGTSSLISIIREFVFTSSYAAKCINEKWYIFQFDLLKSAITTVIPATVGFVISCIFNTNSWAKLVVAVLLAAVISLVAELFVVLNKSERRAAYNLVVKKVFRQ